MLIIKYEKGTIVINTTTKVTFLEHKNWIVYDKRISAYRCLGYYYKELVLYLIKNKYKFQDNIKDYQNLNLKLTLKFEPYSYQKEAMKKWSFNKKGILAMPTGSGKSVMAAMIIEKIQRSVIILVPTIELLIQWHKNLGEMFNTTIGMLGGGNKDIAAITVATYASARIYQNQLGNKFCLLVFDECHHVGAESHLELAKSYIAPYRLGLTATPDEEEYRSEAIKEVLGDIIYEKNITELSGNYLADYYTKTIFVQLTQLEKEKYQYHRNIYLSFRNTVVGFKKNNWQDFIFHASRSKEGRQALKSFQIQKQISFTAYNKFIKLIEILYNHQNERILIFTNDNKTAYRLSHNFLLPVITHEIKIAERKKILENFTEGKWNIIISTRVLNEGVDLPAASVAVIISGNSTVREHVQRLGRILRKKKNKTAYLYELVTEQTGEFFTSQKRKQHSALKQNEKKSFS